MSEQENLFVQLENIIHEDKKLTPKSVDVLNRYLSPKGYKIVANPIRERKFTQELALRIETMYYEFKTDIKNAGNHKSERIVRDGYFQLVYAILQREKFGIANDKNKLINISCSRFAAMYNINRKTLAENKYRADLYVMQGDKLKELKPIYDEIRKRILIYDL